MCPRPILLTKDQWLRKASVLDVQRFVERRSGVAIFEGRVEQLLCILMRDRLVFARQLDGGRCKYVGYMRPTEMKFPAATNRDIQLETNHQRNIKASG